MLKNMINPYNKRFSQKGIYINICIILQGKLPLSGMKVSLHLDEEETDLNAFEISGNILE